MSIYYLPIITYLLSSLSPQRSHTYESSYTSPDRFASPETNRKPNMQRRKWRKFVLLSYLFHPSRPCMFCLSFRFWLDVISQTHFIASLSSNILQVRAMAATPAQTTDSSSKKFRFQSAQKNRKNSKRIHITGESPEENENIDKKGKVAIPTVNYRSVILQKYSSKEFSECLDLIDELFQLPTSHSEYMTKQQLSQIKIIQCACWTMMDKNQAVTLKELNQIIAVEPKNSFAFYALGLAQYRNGELSVCLNSFTRAVDLNPSGAMKWAMEYKAKAKSLYDLLYDGESYLPVCLLIDF